METEQPIFKRIGGAFYPANTKAQSFLDATKMGQQVTMTGRRPRNIRQHALYWALMAKLADNASYTAEDIHEVLKRRIGHTRVIHTAKGDEIVGKPTDFGAMKQDEFAEYFERVRRVILDEIWPHLDETGLQAEIDEMIR